jgi:hypothetical protein
MRASAKPTLAACASLVALVLAVSERPAHAAPRELLVPAGEKGTLAIDQISGFRASMINGLSYAGPIGFMHNQLSEHSLDPQNNGTTTTYTNTFWLAPSADLFVIDRLSIGLLAEFVTTWSSADVPRNNNVTQSVSLPGTNSFTLLPRVGYLIPIIDRFAIWPRAGIGYARYETDVGNPDNAVRASVWGGVVDLDVGFLYRFNETFFARAAPELAFMLFGRHDQTVLGVSTSADAGYLQFSVAVGIGVFLPVY